MKHHEIKICLVFLGQMVVPTSCYKGKEIPPWHNIPKLDGFLQAVVAMNVLTEARLAMQPRGIEVKP
jgi:hypothetical protein